MPLRTGELTTVALFIALTAAVGLLLAQVPNFELISVTVLVGGWLFGMRRGLFIGVCSAALFSIFNFNGSGLGYPPLLLAQMFCYGVLGWWGGMLRRSGLAVGAVRRRLIFGGTGLGFTASYSMTVSIASFLASGFSPSQWPGLLAAGLLASVFHIGMNTVIFTVLAPVMIDRLARQRIGLSS